MWKYVNKETIMTMGVWALLAGLVTIGYQDHGRLGQLETTLYPHLEATEKIISEAAEERAANEDKLQELIDYHKRDFLLTGTGSVGTFGGDESFLRVNRRSDATVYKDGDRILIKCIDVEGKPEAVLTVSGTFSDSNTDLLISFSSEAAEGLGITGRVEVEMEPAEK